MAKETINIGTSELAGDGESIRSAFDKVNSNFDEVYSDISTLDGSKIVFGDLSVTTASASGGGSLSYDNTTGVFTFTPSAAGFDGDYNSLTNKPTIPTVPTAVSAFTNDSGYITGYTVTESDVTTHQAALSITESQISDLQSYLTAEQHGNFTLSGNSITTSNGDDGIDLVISGATSDPTPAFISKGWRFVNDGSLEFRNPIDFSPVQATVTVAKIGQWDTAYSWGDHSTAGYITGYTVTESDVTAHQSALSITESQVSDLGNYVESDTTGITGADAVTNIVSLTQAEYDAIVTPDASTVYFIVG